MSFQNENIGMMDEGYFVSRGDILNWLNSLLNINLTKIEMLGSGAVYCQVIDVIHPSNLAINKVNWRAKNEYQFIQNYKILQDSFKKVGIKRYVQVEKLSKAKYQDNLEFAQWLKRYYDLNCGDRGNNYLADQRRGGVQPDFSFAEKSVTPKTYNGTGQIIAKKELSPPKKKEVAVEPVKKTVTTYAPPPKSKDIDRPKKIETSKQKKGDQGQKLQHLNNRIKEMDDKFEMISQIIRSSQDSNLKVQMIAELLQIQLQVEHKKQQQTEETQQAL